VVRRRIAAAAVRRNEWAESHRIPRILKKLKAQSDLRRNEWLWLLLSLRISTFL